MKYRVLLNTETHYLSITTSDVADENLTELFSVNAPNQQPLCLTLCKMFCLGYLQGNSRLKVKNSPTEFE